MRNYTQRGDVLAVTAPYNLKSGEGMLVGALFGIATADAAEADEVQMLTVGVVELAKVEAEAWTQGQKIYWNNVARLATGTAAGNTLIGAATLAAANPSAIGTVVLNGTVR